MNRIVFSNAWEAPLIRCMGAMYAASDLVALWTMFDKLPDHHQVPPPLRGGLLRDQRVHRRLRGPHVRLATHRHACCVQRPDLRRQCLPWPAVPGRGQGAEKRRLAGFCLSVYTLFVTLSVVWQAVSLWFTYPYWGATTPFYLAAVALIYWDDFTSRGTCCCTPTATESEKK